MDIRNDTLEEPPEEEIIENEGKKLGDFNCYQFNYIFAKHTLKLAVSDDESYVKKNR